MSWKKKENLKVEWEGMGGRQGSCGKVEDMFKTHYIKL